MHFDPRFSITSAAHALFLHHDMPFIVLLVLHNDYFSEVFVCSAPRPHNSAFLRAFNNHSNPMIFMSVCQSWEYGIRKSIHPHPIPSKLHVPPFCIHPYATLSMLPLTPATQTFILTLPARRLPLTLPM